MIELEKIAEILKCPEFLMIETESKEFKTALTAFSDGVAEITKDIEKYDENYVSDTYFEDNGISEVLYYCARDHYKQGYKDGLTAAFKLFTEYLT